MQAPGVDRCGDKMNVGLHLGPLLPAQDNDGNFGSIGQLTVSKTIPTLMCSRADRVAVQNGANGYGRCLIEQDPHLRGEHRGSVETSGGEFYHGFSPARG